LSWTRKQHARSSSSRRSKWMGWSSWKALHSLVNRLSMGSLDRRAF